MRLEKQYLDLILVPTGLIFMFGYHLYLLYKILRYPHTTVIGYENHNKLAWVERMLQGGTTDTAVALQVISSNISASTYLASLSITLSSLIGTWVGNSSSKIFMEAVIYGDTSPSTSSIKFITLLSFFLMAFTSFVQSRSVIRGSNFWSLGLRALYFATSLLLWIFGPIPMFACSLCMVVALNILDSNSTPLHKYPPLSKGQKKRQSGKQNGEILFTEPMSTLSLNAC